MSLFSPLRSQNGQSQGPRGFAVSPCRLCLTAFVNQRVPPLAFVSGTHRRLEEGETQPEGEMWEEQRIAPGSSDDCSCCFWTKEKDGRRIYASNHFAASIGFNVSVFGR